MRLPQRAERWGRRLEQREVFLRGLALNPTSSVSGKENVLKEYRAARGLRCVISSHSRY